MYGVLVDAEWGRRQINKLNRNIEAARFSIPSATVEGIEYHSDRRLDTAAMLRYSTCQYTDDDHHIVLKGAAGSGKYISPVRLETPPAANSRKSDISVCRRFWMN